MRFFTLILLFLLSVPQYTRGEDSTAVITFEKHTQLAREYDQVSLFAESIEETKAAIEIAHINDWLEEVISWTIFLAEVKRKTKDFDESLSILHGLVNSINYPKQHVRKLGRIAALFNEGVLTLTDSQRQDSARIYLDSAISIANKSSLKSEQAGLYNELGYMIGTNNIDSCLHYLSHAAQLFLEMKDTQNYVGARTNMLRTFETVGDSLNVFKTFEELNQLVRGKNWYTSERELYNVISTYYRNQGDSVNANYWLVKHYQSNQADLKNISSTQLDSYRALYETKKYQDKAAVSAAQLKKEAARRQELILYFSILAVLSFGVFMLLFRERRLKKEVNKANESYHTLLVESNHRIKNNLQMIISMLEYANKDLKDKDVIAFNRMSGKIQTISALHHHLYLDVHNEKVELSTYFDDIIELYENIGNRSFIIDKQINGVTIRSERIVYFGLIFNEMLSNTIEHGNATTKHIRVKVEDLKGRLRFSYQDGSKFNRTSTNGTGIQLIEQLVDRVDGINFKLDSSMGKYQFDFYV